MANEAGCYMRQGALGRWIIVNARDKSLAWSGSRWVKHQNGIPKGAVQVSNFEMKLAAYRDAERAGLNPALRGYSIDEDSITCFRCGMTSYNENDRRERYCGNCHEFHEDPKGSVQ